MMNVIFLLTIAKGEIIMYEVIEKEKFKIENMIYEIRGVQVMLNSEIVVIKCHDYFYDNIGAYKL